MSCKNDANLVLCALFVQIHKKTAISKESMFLSTALFCTPKLTLFENFDNFHMMIRLLRFLSNVWKDYSINHYNSNIYHPAIVKLLPKAEKVKEKIYNLMIKSI